MVHTQEWSVLHLCTKFEADCSIGSNVMRGSDIFEIGSSDPGHAYIGVDLWSVCSRVPSSMSGKFEADISIRSNVIRGTKIWKFWVT